MPQFPAHALPPSSELHGNRIMRFLGQGGFAITYQARADRGQGELVAMKEFYPSELVQRGRGKIVVPRRDVTEEDLEPIRALFKKEAEIICSFRHRNLVSGLDYFEELGTAYLVMRYETGQSLRFHLRNRASGGFVPDLKSVAKLLTGLMDGVEHSHAKNCLHCDIKPANIFLNRDHTPVLLDFGAVRHAIDERIRKPGGVVAYTVSYAPIEQSPEGTGEMGPWTDIYQIGAVIYRCITGYKIPSAEDRVKGPDCYEPLVVFFEGKNIWPLDFLKAIDWALAIRPESRPQTIAQWRRGLAPLLKMMRAGQMPAARPVQQPVPIAQPVGQPPPAPPHVPQAQPPPVPPIPPVAQRVIDPDAKDPNRTSTLISRRIQKSTDPPTRPKRGIDKALAIKLLIAGLSIVIVVLLFLIIFD